MMEKQCWWFFLRLSFNILSKKSHKALFVGLEWLEFLYLGCLWQLWEGMKQQGWPLPLLSRGSGLFLIRMERSRARFLLPPNVLNEHLPKDKCLVPLDSKKESKRRKKNGYSELASQRRFFKKPLLLMYSKVLGGVTFEYSGLIFFSK